MLHEFLLLFSMDHNSGFIWAAYGIVIFVLLAHFYLIYKQSMSS